MSGPPPNTARRSGSPGCHSATRRRWLALLLTLACSLLGGRPGHAEPAGGAADSLTPAQARLLLDMLQDDRARQGLIEGLRGVAGQPSAPSGNPTIGTGPPSAEPAAATATPAPPDAAPPPAQPAAPAKPASPLVAGGLGEQLVVASAGWLETLSSEVTATVRAVTGFPALVRWARDGTRDPLIRQRTLDAAAKCALILGAALVVQLLARLLLRRWRRRLDEASARDAAAPAVDETVLPAAHPRVRAARALGVWQRLPGALLRALLGFLPAAAFAGTAYLLLGAGFVVLFTTKMIVLEVLHAYLLFWALVAVARLLSTDRVAHWRLIDLGDSAAGFLDPWVRWLVALATIGGALARVGGRLGLSEPAQEGLLTISALGVHIGLIVVVWRARRVVARKLKPRPGLPALWATLATTYAERWHWIASVLLIASWAVWAVQRQQGVEHVLSLFGLSFVVAVGARLVLLLALGSLDRAFHVGGAGAAIAPGNQPAPSVWARRAARYYPMLRRLVGLTVLTAAVLTMLEVWGYRAFNWFGNGQVGSLIVSAFGTTLTILFVSLLVWEGANALIDRHLQTLASSGQFTKAGRLRTLAPLLRTCLLGVILVVIVLTALSELGVNIGPLLAGAGIFGVALGFGSQKLVQDFITGIFLLLENAMQVGEWVTVSGLSGTVENLSVRTIRLRAGDGSVHVIPFSSVTTVTNTNRGIGNAAVSVTVSIEEDVDRVGEALKKIASEMRADPDYRSGIRADLALWGVDKVDASTVTLVGQIECTDAARWGVQREFNRRVKKRFQDLGIRLANPAQTWLIEEAPRLAASHSARPHALAEATQALGRVADPGDSAASSTRSPPPAALGNTQ